MHHGKSAGLSVGIPRLCVTSQRYPSAGDAGAQKDGSMRPRKCASGNFPWWLRQYPLSIHREMCFVCSVVLCCVAMRCFFWPVLGEWCVSEHR